MAVHIAVAMVADTAAIAADMAADMAAVGTAAQLGGAWGSAWAWDWKPRILAIRTTTTRPLPTTTHTPHRRSSSNHRRCKCHPKKWQWLRPLRNQRRAGTTVIRSRATTRT